MTITDVLNVFLEPPLFGRSHSPGMSTDGRPAPMGISAVFGVEKSVHWSVVLFCLFFCVSRRERANNQLRRLVFPAFSCCAEYL